MCPPLIAELVEGQQCGGSEDAVQQRIAKLVEEWEFLTSKSKSKSEKLQEANRQRQYTAAVKDLEFWLGEVSVLNAILIQKIMGPALNMPNITCLEFKYN